MADFATYNISDDDRKSVIIAAAWLDGAAIKEILNTRYNHLTGNEKARVRLCALKQSQSRLHAVCVICCFICYVINTIPNHIFIFEIQLQYNNLYNIL